MKNKTTGTPATGSPLNKITHGAPLKHLSHGPFSNADHSIADHAKNFIKNPLGTTKKVVKQTTKKVKRGIKNVARNTLYGLTYGPLSNALGYDHPFGGKSNPSVKNEKYGGKKKQTKSKKKVTKKVDNTPKDPYSYY